MKDDTEILDGWNCPQAARGWTHSPGARSEHADLVCGDETVRQMVSCGVRHLDPRQSDQKRQISSMQY